MRMIVGRCLARANHRPATHADFPEPLVILHLGDFIRVDIRRATIDHLAPLTRIYVAPTCGL